MRKFVVMLKDGTRREISANYFTTDSTVGILTLIGSEPGNHISVAAFSPETWAEIREEVQSKQYEV